MDISAQIVEKIIKAQENIIGPIALEQAQKVAGITIDTGNHVTVEGDKKSALENLVKQYEKLFGPASIEVCRDAVRNIVSQAPKDQIPQLLL